MLWSLTTGLPGMAQPLQQFFLGCGIVAGACSALTVKRAILYIQALPAALTLRQNSRLKTS